MRFKVFGGKGHFPAHWTNVASFPIWTCELEGRGHRGQSVSMSQGQFKYDVYVHPLPSEPLQLKFPTNCREKRSAIKCFYLFNISQWLINSITWVLLKFDVNSSLKDKTCAAWWIHTACSWTFLYRFLISPQGSLKLHVSAPIQFGFIAAGWCTREVSAAKSLCQVYVCVIDRETHTHLWVCTWATSCLTRNAEAFCLWLRATESI